MSLPYLRLAILDMNNNVSNKGLGYLIKLVESYHGLFDYDVFDVRYRGQIPDDSYDVYLCTGGPGSPWDMEGGWDKPYFALLDRLRTHNQDNERKKFVFFICHSFQLACIHFKVGTISERSTMSFGIYPVDKTEEAAADPIFSQLPPSFYAADFRYWQVTNADPAMMEREGFRILAMENEISQLTADKAIMAIRFSGEFMGTQFHPEADAPGMLQYLREDERRKYIIEEYGYEKYQEMMDHSNDPDKIQLTHTIILPSFLNHAVMVLTGEPMDVLTSKYRKAFGLSAAPYGNA